MPTSADSRDRSSDETVRNDAMCAFSAAERSAAGSTTSKPFAAAIRTASTSATTRPASGTVESFSKGRTQTRCGVDRSSSAARKEAGAVLNIGFDFPRTGVDSAPDAGKRRIRLSMTSLATFVAAVCLPNPRSASVSSADMPATSAHASVPSSRTMRAERATTGLRPSLYV